MKRIFVLGWLCIALAVLLAFLLWPVGGVQALPEYSAQTGEPCSTCHVSPSGGGSRTPRGQAWIAAEKPGTVPDLLSSLDLLGVDLDIDPADFTDVPDEIPPAQPLQLKAGQAESLYGHLSTYPGN
jgi:hypothetical protein